MLEGGRWREERERREGVRSQMGRRERKKGMEEEGETMEKRGAPSETEEVRANGGRKVEERLLGKTWVEDDKGVRERKERTRGGGVKRSVGGRRVGYYMRAGKDRRRDERCFVWVPLYD